MNATAQESPWHYACDLEDILPNTGVCALVDGRQIAIFRLDPEDEVYAIANHDPNSGANVISRGLVGDLGGRLVVASPIYKHHYCLRSGECLENPDTPIATYPVRVDGGKIWLNL